MKQLFKVLAFLAAAASSPAAVFTNAVSVDAFVRAAAPTINYGAAGTLAVSGSAAVNASGVANGVFDTFIRFNTAAMVASFNSLYGSNNWSVTGAQIQVTETGAPNNAIFNRGVGSFQIRWIANDSWTEGTGTPGAPTTDGISYNDEAALLNSAVDANLGVFTNAGMNETLTFPLALPAAFVTNLGAGGEAGFYMTAVAAGTGFTFDSRSFGTVSARPILIVSALPAPGFSSLGLSGGNVVFEVTNGVAGATYQLLGSSSLSLPRNQWLPVATNVPGSNGGFTLTLTNGINGQSPSSQFFLLQGR